MVRCGKGSARILQGIPLVGAISCCRVRGRDGQGPDRRDQLGPKTIKNTEATLEEKGFEVAGGWWRSET